MLTLTLPWPPRELNPNTRHAHWSKLATAKRRYRAACAIAARSQGAARIEAGELAVSLLFVPPDRRARDLDNMLASAKALIDGLADVLGVDDSKWALTVSKSSDAQAGGFVRVEVSQCP